MGKIINGLLDFLRLDDENDNENEEDFLDDFEVNKPQDREPVVKRPNPPLRRDTRDSFEDFSTERTDRRTEQETLRDKTEKLEKKPFTLPKRTAVPLRSEEYSTSKIIVLNPRSFEDAKIVCDTLMNGGAVLMSFEGVNQTLAQRLMDFSGGVVYALNGEIYQISNGGYIVASENFEINGDVLANLSGKGIPNFPR